MSFRIISIFLATGFVLSGYPAGAQEPAAGPETESETGEQPSVPGEESAAEVVPADAGEETEAGTPAGPGAGKPEPASLPAAGNAAELRKEKALREILGSPLGGGRNSFLCSTLGLPGMRAGSTIPSGLWEFSLSGELSGGKTGNAAPNAIDYVYFETVLKTRTALSEMLEFNAAFAGAVFGGDADLTWNGVVISGPDRDESFQLSRVTLGMKMNLLPLGSDLPEIWLALDFKIPATDKDLADSGRPALSFSFDASKELGPLRVHLNFGWYLSDGQANFKPVEVSPGVTRRFVPDNIFLWGLSVAMPLGDSFSVVAQEIGNTNAFRDLGILDSDVHVLMLGAKYARDSLFIEIGGGAGLTDSSLDYTGRLEIGAVF